MAKLQFLVECGAKVVEARNTQGSVQIAFEENGTRMTSDGPKETMRWTSFASNQEETVTEVFHDNPDRILVRSGQEAQTYKERMAQLAYQLEGTWKVIE